MRTTLILDDGLIERARQLTGVQEKTSLVHEGSSRADRPGERPQARGARRLGADVESAAPAAPDGAVILVDTSVWVDHFRRTNVTLSELLEHGDVATHPFVIGELALGILPKRREILEAFETLPAATLARHDDVMALVERRSRDLFIRRGASPDVRSGTLQHR